MDLSSANITYRACRSLGPAWRDRALLDRAAGGGAGRSGHGLESAKIVPRRHEASPGGKEPYMISLTEQYCGSPAGTRPPQSVLPRMGEKWHAGSWRCKIPDPVHGEEQAIRVSFHGSEGQSHIASAKGRLGAVSANLLIEVSAYRPNPLVFVAHFWPHQWLDFEASLPYGHDRPAIV
jgi:hypothetical protein